MVDRIFQDLLNLLDNFGIDDGERVPEMLGYSDFLNIIEELTDGWTAQDLVNFLEVCPIK